MILPTYLWMKGKYVSEIVQETTISPGHFCKEILRVSELLQQLEDAAKVIGDIDLEDLCSECNRLIKHGLPYVKSMYL